MSLQVNHVEPQVAETGVSPDHSIADCPCPSCAAVGRGMAHDAPLAAPSGLTYRPLAYPGAPLAGEPAILKTIDWGGRTNVIPGDNVIRVYFAKNGESFDGNTSQGWNAYEKQQAMLAFQQYENIINVDVVETATAGDADLKLVTSNLNNGVLGFFGPPGTGAGAGVGVFSRKGQGWNEGGNGGLEQGGYGFVTMIHEFGHAFGLAHPHDTGGGSTVMPGVTGPFGSYGDAGLNQGVFTTMSYNDGWRTGAGESPSFRYGYQGTMMALDVALLQLKYGADTTFHAHNDIYKLSSSNGPGTFYSSIWDTGGRDKIAYGGAKDSFIDLRAATIDYSSSGGGNLSIVYSGDRSAPIIFGGFTIARGVYIENGRGGKGDDWVIGNNLKNNLIGGDGNDSIASGGGRDVMTGGAGQNIFYFDVFDTRNTAQVKDFDEGTGSSNGDLVDLQYIDANENVAGVQHFTFADGPGGGYSGTAGEILLTADDADTVRIHLDTDGDKVDDMQMLLNGYGGGGTVYFTFESLDGGTGRYDGPAGYDLVT